MINPVGRKRPCLYETRNPARLIGAAFELELKRLKHEYVMSHDQNLTILIAGKTGSGKSSVLLHGFSILEGEVDFSRLGWTIQTNAKAYDRARKLGNYSVYGHDELKLYSRRSMSEHNNDFLDLLFSVRGENLILFANAPSPRSIDKIFLEEALIDVLVFIHRDQARLLWIPYDSLMRLKADYGNLDYNTLMKYGVYYAKFDTYFSRVPDSVWSEYQEYKKEGMRDIGDAYVEKYAGGERFSMMKVSKKLNVHYQTALKWAGVAYEQGLLPPGAKNSAGTWSLNGEMVDDLRDFILKQSSGVSN